MKRDNRRRGLWEWGGGRGRVNEESRCGRGVGAIRVAEEATSSYLEDRSSNL